MVRTVCTVCLWLMFVGCGSAPPPPDDGAGATSAGDTGGETTADVTPAESRCGGPGGGPCAQLEIGDGED